MPIKERYVWVCTNRRADGHPKGSCAEKGSERLKDELKAACHEARLGDRVRVNSSGCIDLCEHGIAVAVMPENTLLGGFTSADIPALVEGLHTHGGAGAHPQLAARKITAETPVPAPVQGSAASGVVQLGRKPAV